MAHNTIQEMKEILAAIEQGKKIQYQMANPDDPDKWCGYAGNTPNFFAFCYRIKPEKKWRPFKDTAELFAHNNGSKILWLKDKDTCWRRMVTFYSETEIAFSNDAEFTMEEVFNEFTFADGRPCGVEG